MNISIFGLGYVGCVSLGCLAQNGHYIIGVDISQAKVDLINKGIPTIIENKIDKIIAKQYNANLIKATSDYFKAIKETEISIICVGTPSTQEGHLDLSHIYNTAEQIGQALIEKDDFHTVVIRSTVLPGTNFKFGEIMENISGKKRNTDFAIVSNPEFLREGNAVEDYFNPPVTIIGSDNNKAIEKMKKVYEGLKGPVEIVDIEIAEMIKYVNNSFHALKITFANEVGNICKKLGIDSHELMRIFCLDNKLNISCKYLKPGFAYGGSCLPKDLKALKTLAHDFYLETPVLNTIEISNNYQKNLAIDLILKTEKNKIGFFGIAFKEGTDDLRYSPAIDLIEKLIGKGKEIFIYDKYVHLSKLIGSNKSFIEEKLPHISSLVISDIDLFISTCEVLVFSNSSDNINSINIPPEKIIIDFARNNELKKAENYFGLSW
jgi:GDP-mannose 6-dehydrogenase